MSRYSNIPLANIPLIIGGNLRSLGSYSDTNVSSSQPSLTSNLPNLESNLLNSTCDFNNPRVTAYLEARYSRGANKLANACSNTPGYDNWSPLFGCYNNSRCQQLTNHAICCDNRQIRGAGLSRDKRIDIDKLTNPVDLAIQPGLRKFTELAGIFLDISQSIIELLYSYNWQSNPPVANQEWLEDHLNQLIELRKQTIDELKNFSQDEGEVLNIYNNSADKQDFIKYLNRIISDINMIQIQSLENWFTRKLNIIQKLTSYVNNNALPENDSDSTKNLLRAVNKGLVELQEIIEPIETRILEIESLSNIDRPLIQPSFVQPKVKQSLLESLGLGEGYQPRQQDQPQELLTPIESKQSWQQLYNIGESKDEGKGEAKSETKDEPIFDPETIASIEDELESELFHQNDQAIIEALVTRKRPRAKSAKSKSTLAPPSKIGPTRRLKVVSRSGKQTGRQTKRAITSQQAIPSKASTSSSTSRVKKLPTLAPTSDAELIALQEEAKYNERFQHPKPGVYNPKTKFCPEIINRVTTRADNPIPIKPYQLGPLKILAHPNNNGVIAIHETGSGKTLTAIIATECTLSLNKDITRAVIIVPLSVQDDWVREFKRYQLPPGYTINKQGIAQFNTGPPLPGEPARQIDLYNIQTFVNVFDCLAQPSRCQPPSPGNNDCRNILLIIDEVHMFKTEIKQRQESSEGTYAKRLIACAKRAKKVLLLSATPTPNEPNDILNIVGLINRTRPPTKAEWRSMTPERKSLYLKNKISYYKCKQNPLLPRTTVKVIPIPMTPDYLREYLKIEQDAGKRSKAFQIHLRSASNKIAGVQNPKVQWTLNLINNPENAGKKIIIFSGLVEHGYLQLADQLDQQARVKTGRNTSNINSVKNRIYTEISGPVSELERELGVARYRAKPNQKVWITDNGQVEILNPEEYKDLDPRRLYDPVNIILLGPAAKVGLNLRNTDIVVSLQPEWNLDGQLQFEARGIRMFSTPEEAAQHQVTVYRLALVKQDLGRELTNYDIDKLLQTSSDDVTQEYGIDLYLYLRQLSKSQQNAKQENELLKPNSIEGVVDC